MHVEGPPNPVVVVIRFQEYFSPATHDLCYSGTHEFQHFTRQYLIVEGPVTQLSVLTSSASEHSSVLPTVTL